MRRRDGLPWAPVVGQRAARGLAWLERAAGARAVQKFLGGKVRGSAFSGQYLTGIAGTRAGRSLIAELLDRLRRSEAIPVCDVDSYYAAGKRWPLGMTVRDGCLVDVWLPAEPPSPFASTPGKPYP